MKFVKKSILQIFVEINRTPTDILVILIRLVFYKTTLHNCTHTAVVVAMDSFFIKVKVNAAEPEISSFFIPCILLHCQNPAPTLPSMQFKCCQFCPALWSHKGLYTYFFKIQWNSPRLVKWLKCIKSSISSITFLWWQSGHMWTHNFFFSDEIFKVYVLFLSVLFSLVLSGQTSIRKSWCHTLVCTNQKSVTFEITIWLQSPGCPLFHCWLWPLIFKDILLDSLLMFQLYLFIARRTKLVCHSVSVREVVSHIKKKKTSVCILYRRVSFHLWCFFQPVSSGHRHLGTNYWHKLRHQSLWVLSDRVQNSSYVVMTRGTVCSVYERETINVNLKKE